MNEDELFDEFIKCSKDPIYFIRQYIKVVHQKRGLLPFDLYPFQEDIIRAIGGNRFNIIRKFRQAGITTIACAYALWIVIFQAHKSVVILSIGDREATEVLDRINIMFDELPDFIRPKSTERNKHNLKLENFSRIKSLPSSKGAGRSLAGAFLIVDEAAHIDIIGDIWGAAYPILSTGGQALVISTVNGVGNWYYDIYQGAVKEENEFNVVDIKWQQHPEYIRTPGYEHLYEEMLKWDPPANIDDWEKITRSNIGAKLWRQEYECEFLGTGETFLDEDTLRHLYDNTDENYRSRYSNRMRVWKKPIQPYEYVIGVDVSFGRRLDYSAFHIVNAYNGEQVAEFYANSIGIDDFAKVLNDVGLSYNTAMIVVERNGIGSIVANKLFQEYEYPNVWADLDNPKMEMGVLVKTIFRDKLLSEMEIALRTNQLKINSERTVDELLTFIINDVGKVEADVGKHDDLVMSLALTTFALQELRGTTPIDFVHNEEGFVDPAVATSLKTPYKFQISSPDGSYIDDEDYRWLVQ